MDLVLMWLSNWLVFYAGGQIYFVALFGPEINWFSCMDQGWLDSTSGIAIDLIFLWRLKMTSFWCGDRLTLYLRRLTWLAENHLVLVWASSFTSFFVWVVENDLISMWSISLDLISVQTSELPWGSCGGRKGLGCSVCIAINLDFVSRHQNWVELRVGIEIDLISVARQNLVIFVWGVECHWVFVLVVAIALISVWGIQLD